MSLLQIVTWPNPVLDNPADPVTKFDGDLKKLVKDMFETMYAAPGVGLAAVQVGVPKRLFVMDCSGGKDPDRTFPALVSYSAKGFEVQANKPGQAGYRLLTGVPQPDGGMRLAGNAVGDPKNGFYAASVDGRFSGNRYEGKGKFLDRNCILSFARP